MKRLIIVYVFILITLTLTLQSHNPIDSAQSKLTKKAQTQKNAKPNNTQYLLFMDQLNKITNEAGFVLRTLQLGFGKNFGDLIENFKKYNTGLEAIRKVLKKFNLFIQQKEKLCPKQQSFNKSEIYRYINFTEQKQSAILKQVQGNPQFDKMKENIQKMKKLSDNYLIYIKKTIQGSFCNQPDLLKSDNASSKQKKEKLYYKNNLDVSNWYYGSTNQVKYKAYLLKKAANFNLSTCPIDKPFVRDDQQKCFNCPPSTIYNLGAEKCDTCPHGQMLNVATGNCQPCFGEMFIINHQFVCKACAIESEQLFDPKTGKCYKCKDTQYLDTTARACKLIKCPADQPKFDRQLQQCQKCNQDQIINPNNPTICIPRCTKQKPLYNNNTKSCIQCGKDQIYVAETKSCKKLNSIPESLEPNESQTSNQNAQSIKNNQNQVHTTQPQQITPHNSQSLSKVINNVLTTTVGDTKAITSPNPIQASPNKPSEVATKIQIANLTVKK